MQSHEDAPGRRRAPGRKTTLAAQMLGDLIDGKAPSPSRVELSTELIVRESTAPPALQGV